jgi:hypothetical protein
VSERLNTRGRICFDQSHNQHGWHGGRTGAKPLIEEYGYRAARESAQQAGYTVEPLSRKITGPGDLAGCDILVLVAPYHILLQPAEIEQLARFVQNGKSLLVTSYYAGDAHHGNNLSELGRQLGAGVEFRSDRVGDAGHHRRHRYEILIEDIPQQHELLQGVHRLCLNRTCSLEVSAPAQVVLRSSVDSFTDKADVTDTGHILSWTETGDTEVPLLAVSSCGDGRFAALGTWEVFLSEYIESEEFGNRQLYQNLLRWLMAGRGLVADRSEPAAAAGEVVPGGLDYERGLRSLRARLTERSPGLLTEFHTLEARLLENLGGERLYGSNETVRVERAQALGALNDLALRAGLESSFNDLCRR